MGVNSSSSIQNWFLAARPKTLWAGAVPVLLGCAIAYDAGAFRPLPGLVILCTALLIQIATNFANDVFDFERGSDTEHRLGPKRMVQAGLIAPSAMKRATVLLLGVALLLGCYLVYLGGWPILIVGCLSLVLAIAYTAGPYALAYTGLGDVFVLLFFGPIAVGGTYYIFTQQLNSAVLLSGTAIGMLATGILVVNNLRDIEGDSQSGKRTTAVRFGPMFARIEYTLLLLLPGVIAAGIAYSSPEHRALLLSLLYIFLALPLIGDVFRYRGPKLNIVLEKTAKLLLFFGLLLSAAWLL